MTSAFNTRKTVAGPRPLTARNLRQAEEYPHTEPSPAIGIYTGSGASHSWLWFVEILDRLGFRNISFPDEQEIGGGALDALEVLLVSGGDTFAIAAALGAEGSRRIRSFVEGGGLYIGSCAGAYLPLTSSLYPLSLFNYAAATISNLTAILPTPVALPEKFCTPYGCNYVFHPVREEIRLQLEGGSFPRRSRECRAPLYGGPSFHPSDDVTVLARYSGFTEQTLFMTDRQLAHDTLIGKAALVSKRLGTGQLFLLGPHLEHPQYQDANMLVADMIGEARGACRKTPPLTASPPERDTGSYASLWRDIKSQISNARIVAIALERNQVTWTIGRKVYEPLKIRAFLEPLWSRAAGLEGSLSGAEEEDLLDMRDAFSRITRTLRDIKRKADGGVDTSAGAVALFSDLRQAAALFLGSYFATVPSLPGAHKH